MAEIILTKDSDALLCALYKTYLQKRKNGTDKWQAKCFGGAEVIQEQVVPNWSLGDINDSCRELKQKGLLNCLILDNVVSESALTDEGIIYMENRFKNGLSDIMEYIGKIKSILLW